MKMIMNYEKYFDPNKEKRMILKRKISREKRTTQQANKYVDIRVSHGIASLDDKLIDIPDDPEDEELLDNNLGEDITSHELDEDRNVVGSQESTTSSIFEMMSQNATI